MEPRGGGVSMEPRSGCGVEASVPHSAAVRLEDPSGQVGLFTINSTYNHRESKGTPMLPIPESKVLLKGLSTIMVPKNHPLFQA